jgi:hypothetical protein
MSQASTKTQTAIPRSAATRPDVSTRWVYQPLRDKRMAILVISGFVVMVIAVVAVVTSKAYLAVLAGAATAVVVWRSYLPVNYELSHKGLRQTVMRWNRTIPWNMVAAIRMRDDGFLIEGRANLSRWDWRRDLFAPWGEHEAEVRECLTKLVPHLLYDNQVVDVARESETSGAE